MTDVNQQILDQNKLIQGHLQNVFDMVFQDRSDEKPLSLSEQQTLIKIKEVEFWSATAMAEKSIDKTETK